MAAKLKRTRSQQKILNLLNATEQAKSAQDIYIELRNRDEAVGLATVYRALDALRLEGIIKTRTLANGESLYSSLQEEQHHLTCLKCRKSIPIDECPVHELEKKLQRSQGFKIFYHTLEFFGLCDRCQMGSVNPE